MSSPEVLDLSLAGYAALVARAGVDPDAEVRRFDGTDPGIVYAASGGFGNAARGMEQAWTSSWDAQAVLAGAYTVDGAPVRDRATHEAALPAGFRGAAEQLELTGNRVGAVATSLSWESAQARSRLRTLHGDVSERAAAWARDVAAAGLIPPDQVQAWLDARTRVEQQIVDMITDAHATITGSVGRYEDVIATALAGLAEHGFTEAGPAAPAAPAPAGEPPVLAGLGTPVHAGLAADPVTTALGNFVETETDLAFTGPAAGLTLTRTHNSRDPGTPGPFGPRWASWASTRLTADGPGAHYVGPDGRQVTVPRLDGDRFARVPDLAARVLPGPDGGLVLAWNDGRRWIFTAAGRLLATDHGPGTAVTVTHDEYDRLTRLTHVNGTEVVLTWAGTSITHATSSDGRTVDYHYDDGGRLVRVEAPAGDRHYGIDGDGRVATVTDADGVVELVNTYDTHGRVIRQVAPHGRVVTFDYDAGVTTTVADETGGPVDVYRHDDAGRLVEAVDGHGQVLRKRYDGWGNAVEVVRRGGGVVRRAFDDRGRVVRQVAPTGAITTYRHDDADRVVRIAVTGPDLPDAVTRLRYDGAERLPSEVVDAEGGVTRLAVSDGLVHALTDADGVTVRFRYDAGGRLVAAVDAVGGVERIERDAAGRPVAVTTPSGRRTELTYDRRGRLVARRDPSGGVWRHEHSAAGRPTATVDPTGARTEIRYGDHGDAVGFVDPLGAVTTAAHDLLGNLAAVTAPDGATWTFTHDALCRLTSLTDPAGGTWLQDHDADGNPTAVTDPTGLRTTAGHDRAGALVTSHDGLAATTVDRDPLGRPVAVRQPDGTVVTVAYDRCGRPVSRTGPDGGVTHLHHSPAGRLVRTVSPAGREEHREYDACGRLAAVVDGTGARWEHRHDADGLLVARVSPAGLVERVDRDNAGRVTRHHVPGRGTTGWTYDPAGRVVAVTDRAGRRTFVRDAAGRVVAATDALGHTTAYAWDDRGRLVAVTDPLGGATRYAHDAVGRVVAVTDPLGRTTRYAHDAAGRLRESIDPDGNRTRWTHDAAGRVGSVTAGDGTTRTVERDVLGRPVRVAETGPSAALTVELTRDVAGRLVRRDAGGRAVGWSYDADGLRSALTAPDGTRTGYERDAAGRVVALTHPVLGRIAHERDADGRTVRVAGAGATTTRSFTDGWLTGHDTTAGSAWRTTLLTRDEHGRVVTAETDGHAHHYTHDAAGQLVSADGWTFRYDAAGRLTHETTPDGERTHTYDAAGQLVSTVGAGGDRSRTHDGTGRRTTDGDRTYRWDSFGRLRTITDPTRSTHLHHDAMGDLAAVDDLPLTWDALHPAGALLAAGDHQVIGLDAPWALAGPDGTHRPLLPDWQGSTGTPGPDPWGGAGPGVGLGYRGELTLHDLVWLRHRAYDLGSRSFLSTDPLPAVPGTAYAANPYHYAGNNPVDNIDPWGLRPMTDEDLAAQGDGGGFSWSALGHGVLDVVGMVPVVGEVADLANAAWYAAEGDWVNAGLALAAAVPFLGWAAVGGKWGIRGVQAVRSMDGARTWLTGRPPMVPRDAVQRPFTPDENFAMGERYVWNRPNAAGNDQNVRYHAHGPDPRRPETENAGAGPIYRIQQGNAYFDAQNVRHPVNEFNPNSPAYNPSAANDTHIPYPADLPRPDRANVPVFAPNVAAIGDPTTEESSR